MEITQQTAIVLAAFLAAGTVKGIIGLGLPMVTLAILVNVVGLVEAVALVSVPALITNIYQGLFHRGVMVLVRRLWPLLIAAVIGTWIGNFALAVGDTDLLTAFLGISLAGFASYGLLRPQIPPPGPREGWLNPSIGLVAGVTHGMTGSFAVPGVIYLQTLGLPRDQLVQVLGIVFTTIALAMLIGLSYQGLFAVSTGVLGLVGVLPAFAGMAIGTRIRKQLPEATFRKVFLLGLFCLGCGMTALSLFNFV